MFYHASPIGNINVLTPHISNHKTPLIYLSTKRENVLVYLSNGIEKHCKEAGFDCKGPYTTWASYGFTKDGILQLDEYYPNATMEVYKGVQGYIYSCEQIKDGIEQKDIPFAVTATTPVTVTNCERISDAYEELLKAAQEEKIILKKYEENSKSMLEWIRKTMQKEYEKQDISPDYKFFLKEEFSFLV